MSVVQIISLLLFGGIVIWTYCPMIALPTLGVTKPKALLDQVAAVVAIREQYPQPDVTAACNDLLHVLLQVPQ
jgi:hypothetical protein